MNKKINNMINIANALVEKTKGILAADESTPTIKKRFESINVESTENTRHEYREMLFGTRGINDFISGVILYDETIHQRRSDGRLLISTLQDAGIIPGIKVDQGTRDLPGSRGDLYTQGLDGLAERLKKYLELGAGFTKWRAVFSIGADTPSSLCIDINAHLLSLFAIVSQEAGLVPIVEPEVLMDGTHTIETCFTATERVLRGVFYQMGRCGVMLEGCLLKTNMVLSGKGATSRARPEEVAKQTLACLSRVVPPVVPGVVFLSGGQGDEKSVTNLNTINQLSMNSRAPWQLSFSYGRGLQALPLKVWSGKPENVKEAQAVFYTRARQTSQARSGTYNNDTNY